MRVEAELIRWLLANDSAAIVSIYDTRSNRFRPLDRAVARRLVAGAAVVETSILPDARRADHTLLGSWARWAGASLQPLLKIRRTLACAADEWRRGAGKTGHRRWLDGLVRSLLDARLRSRALLPDGTWRDLYRLDTVLGPYLQLGPNDTVLLAGLDWNNKNVDAVARLKKQGGFRLVMMCYDFIPWKFPKFYATRDVAVFTGFFRDAIGFVDRFISISQCTTTDLVAFARAHGRTGLDVCNERLGADAARQPPDAGAALPSGLEAGRYVLFVSTVEPRKNHALLLRVWKRLAGRDGGTGGFKLVFAGRRGWMTDDVFAALASDAVLSRDVVHVADASDEMLHRLYSGAAFCVYPSLYEGFGLPVIEAFAHGKPVIASSAGALPEATGGLAPCLAPDDDDAWTETMGRWLIGPELVAEQARRIGSEFAWPTWSEAAARIIAAARARPDSGSRPKA